MADMSKSEKLAAARKRLKEYQQKGKDGQPAGNKPSLKKGTAKPQLDTEGDSSVVQNFVFDSGPAVPVYSENENSGNVTSQAFNEPSYNMHEAVQLVSPPNLNSYFSTNENASKELNISHNGIVKEADTMIRGNSDIQSTFQQFSSPIATFPSFTMSDNSQSTNTHFSDITAARFFFDNFSDGGQNQSLPNVTPSSEVKEAEIPINGPELTNQTNLLHTPSECFSVSNEPQENYVPYVDSNSQDSVLLQYSEPIIPLVNEKSQNSMDDISLANHAEEPPQEQLVPEIVEDVATSESVANMRSTSESLRQLSLQMNGLIEESTQGSSVHGEDSELERRNQELAALLASEKQRTEQLELQLKEYQSGMCRLQVELDQLRTESEARVTRELGPVQEQLQLHVQTVGILVGEKTELQAALTKSQNLAKQKAGEAEELQGRLKASRHKVAELEKEASTLQDSYKKLEKMAHDLSSEVERFKQEQIVTNKSLAEKEEEVSELHQKLKTKTNEYATLQRELQEKQSQLSLSQLRVQQLSTTDNSEVDGQLEAMHQQKISLEKQVAELQQTIKSVGAERDQASQQYQQYVQQLNGQLQSLASKVDSLSLENEQLTNREQSLVRHVSELEKQLQQQQLQNQKRRDSPPRPEPQNQAAVQELEAKLTLKENEMQVLTDKMECQVQENENIKKELEERCNRVEELETSLERLLGDQPDKDKLLAAMESDKVAAARAVGQNQRLKQQLEELQDGFVKMSNDKLVLTEKLQHEQHICKEQGERLAQQEDELKDLRQQLTEKEQKLQQNSTELSNQMLQQSQIVDRMRHYEAHGQLHEILQQELEQAKERVQALSTQNNELRTLLAQHSTHDSGSSSGAGSLDDTLSRKDEMLATLSASVRQLELERDQLLERLQQSEKQEQSLSQHSSPASEKVERNGETASKDYESMKMAMEQLEERFTRTMKEVADLSDEKQRLEHLVLQLQGETETIGEYIALYQVQRSILRQRAQEKDEQLSKLSKDREEMRNKLGELNELVRQLVLEKDAIRKISHSSAPVEHTIEETTNNQAKENQEGIPNGEIVEVEVGKEVNGETDSTPAPSEDIINVDTAGKIMALLSEIGTSSLVEPQTSENFHPCPWCSGQLITV